MELEAEGQTGAGYGGKNPWRLAQRNGYRDRIWETRAARSIDETWIKTNTAPLRGWEAAAKD